MSKYLGTKPPFQQNTYIESQPLIRSTVDDETKSFIFSNISSGNYTILFDKITPDMNLGFNDNENNSVCHALLNVDDKLIPEETKIMLLKFFTKRGAPLNSYNKNRLTPLHIAIKNSKPKIVRYLLENAVNPNAETVNKVTPIQLALDINVKVCDDLLIQTNIGEVENKDKNELKNTVIKEIKKNFDPYFFNLFTKLFDDYKSGYDSSNLKDKITKDILKLTRDSKYNESELKIAIDKKIEQYILDLVKEMGELDSPLRDDVNELLKLDQRPILVFYADELEEKIQKFELEINEMYDQKFKELKEVRDDFQEYFNYYFNNFKLELVCLSKHIFDDGYKKGRLFYPSSGISTPLTNNINAINLFNTCTPIAEAAHGVTPLKPIQPPLKIIDHIYVFDLHYDNSANIFYEGLRFKNGLKKVDTINRVTSMQISNNAAGGAPFTHYANIEFYFEDPPEIFENTLNYLYDNFITTMQLPKESILKFKTMKDDLIKLNRINKLFKAIYFDSFSLNPPLGFPAPPALPPPIPAYLAQDPNPILSYKFKLLNYLKIHTILDYINRVEIKKREFKSDTPNILEFIKKNIFIHNSLYTGVGYNPYFNYMMNQYLDIFYLHRVGVIAPFDAPPRGERGKKDAFDYFIQRDFNLKLPSDIKLVDIPTLLNPGYDDYIDIFNEINKLKYFYNFINDILSAVSDNLNKGLMNMYFDKKIDILNSVKVRYKYTINNNIYPDVGIDPINGQIIAVNDIFYDVNDNYNPEYDFYEKPKTNFQLFLADDANTFNTILKKQEINKNNRFLFRTAEDDIEIYTVTSDVTNFLKTEIIRDMYEKLIDLIASPNTSKIIPNDLLNDYNKRGLEDNIEILKDVIKNTANELIDELLKYYKINYAKKIVKEILTKVSDKESIPNFDYLNIDIKKLISTNYSKKSPQSSMFIDESNELKERNYYYNYKSNDEALLCYKNNHETIIALLEYNNTNHFILDTNKNTILHQLVKNIDNFELFKKIFTGNGNSRVQEKFCKMIRLKNIFNKIPCQIIDEKIQYNNNNFYKVEPAGKINTTELLYSISYSEILLIKLRNNNDIKKNIPKYVGNIFNDLYILFNNKDINTTDILQTIYTKETYDEMYDEYKKLSNNRVSFSLSNIKDDITKIYNIIKKNKYDITKKNMINKYYQQFYNTIAHTITLHFSTVFYNLVYDLLIDTNTETIGINADPDYPQDYNFQELKDSIFKFDPTYKEPNLAQMIILNLYKIKFDDDTIENKSLSSLIEILKFKMSELNNLIVSSRTDNINENLEKIYEYMNTYFDSFNKNIVLFLTNYVKFIELQYNLQEISKLLIANS